MEGGQRSRYRQLGAGLKTHTATGGFVVGGLPLTHWRVLYYVCTWLLLELLCLVLHPSSMQCMHTTHTHTPKGKTFLQPFRDKRRRIAIRPLGVRCRRVNKKINTCTSSFMSGDVPTCLPACHVADVPNSNTNKKKKRPARFHFTVLTFMC